MWDDDSCHLDLKKQVIDDNFTNGILNGVENSIGLICTSKYSVAKEGIVEKRTNSPDACFRNRNNVELKDDNNVVPEAYGTDFIKTDWSTECELNLKTESEDPEGDLDPVRRYREADVDVEEYAINISTYIDGILLAALAF